MSAAATLRWGILAPGRIAEGFVRDLHAAGVGRAVACGSRSLERAQAFAAAFGVERAYGSYEALLADPGVDIVYIASPHTGHHEHTLAALDAGKHVLCEKPLGVNAAQVAAMFARARERGLFLMEAVWSYFLPAHVQALQWVAEGRLGTVTALQANFGFRAPFSATDRLFDPALAGGATLDVGIYPLSFVQRYTGVVAPEVSAVAHLGPTGVDETTLIHLGLPGGVLADLACSITADMTNTATLYGTEGTLRLPNFWRADSVQLEAGGASEFREFRRTTGGYEYEARAVTDAIAAGRTEHDAISGAFSRQLAQTMDEVRRRIGLVYPADTGIG